MADRYLERFQDKYGKKFEIFVDEKGESSIPGQMGQGYFRAVAYKPGWEFLKEGLASLLKQTEDHTLLERPILYTRNGRKFVAQETTDACIENVWPQLLEKFEKQAFKYVRFERLVGFLVGHSTREGLHELAIHEYSGGLELFCVTQDTPEAVRNRIGQVAIHALAELHDLGINYEITVPTNMRYDLHSHIILNPHMRIELRDYSLSQIGATRDISALFLLNSWLPNKDVLLDKYANLRGYTQEETAELTREVNREIRDELSDPAYLEETLGWYRGWF